MTEASKLVGFASLAPADGAAAATKLVAYALMGPEASGLFASKLVAYVVMGPPPTVGELRVLTWTFTLDDHVFLVIQLSSETLVYDFFAEKWYTWGSGAESDGWRAVRGQNWNANLGAIMPGLGGAGQSNVVCGDKETGALYFLDPELVEDDLFDGTPGQQFSRIITGQLALRGHDYVDCPAVEVTGSTGDALGSIADSSVSLSISDDKGHSYWSAGALAVDSGVYDVTLAWRGLGSFTGPGRLFRITDYGALARVDGMDIPDGE
jgi:hypothetical protein